jgi:hypothetical protein
LPTNSPSATKRSVSASLSPTVVKVGDTVTVKVKARMAGGAITWKAKASG